MATFFVKKSKCRDFDEKINQTPLLHSDKFSKVKYLNSANYIVRGVHMPSDSKKKVADSTRIPGKKVADSTRIPEKKVAGILLTPLGFRDSGFLGFH